MTTPLLALETATNVCGVALWHDGAVLTDAHLRRPRIHARHLAPLIQNVLERADCAPADLAAVAVSMGPGSYTGLRIGVSTAKGLARAVDAALVGVPTLEALAASVTPYAAPGDVLCALLDARRDEVYAAAYRVAEDGTLQPHSETKALTVDHLPEWLGTADGRLWLVGDGGSKSEAPLAEAGFAPVRLPFDLHGPSVTWVARRAVPRLEAGTVEDLASFEPYYLKAFAGTKPKHTPFERLSH